MLDFVGVTVGIYGFQTIEKGTKHKVWENAACSNRLIELALHYHSSSEVFSTCQAQLIYEDRCSGGAFGFLFGKCPL